MPVLLLLAGLCQGGQTRTWVQSEYAEFEKGNLKNLSLRNDGRLSLAPHVQERFDSSSAYLWAMAQDSAGNLYAGGGPGAKLYRISLKGEKKTLADLNALEIHAIAVDRKDRVFAATSPDGKVYRISGKGKSEVFYDPKTKYIWAMAFDHKGNLFVATGDQGEVHRVSPDGKGSVFFKSDDTHMRSMVVDANDNLIVGTEPSGLVLRIAADSKSGVAEGFVLYEMPKKEVTVVAIGPDGSIYAAGVGNKQFPSLPPSPPPPPPSPAPAATPAGPPGAARAAAPPPATFNPSAAAALTGGSDVYIITTAGFPRRLWTHSQDFVYAIGFDAAGRVLVGAGNKGSIYRLDSENVYYNLVNLPPTQVTAFQAGRGGSMYAATGNVGKIYEIGPGLEHEGWIESDVFDAGTFSQWGRLYAKSALNGGQVTLEARSGNVDRPQKNWSQWAETKASAGVSRVASPPARFAQWKATLSTGNNGHSPEVESVELAYLPQNLEPHVEEVETTPPNYRFPASGLSLSSPPSLSLPPIGRRSRPNSSPPILDAGTPSMQYAKGYIGARWSASDENGDTLIYTVQIRGVQESEWKLLKDKVKDKHMSWDSTAFPDGEYRLRVIASDLPSNTKETALTGQLESEPFVIDNTPPRISELAAARNAGRLQVRWKANDALSVIMKAEYSVDGGEWMIVTPTTKLSDAPQLDYELVLDGLTGSEHTIAVRVQDEYDNQATDKLILRF